jgi:histidinol-phosphate aminotransferase
MNALTRRTLLHVPAGAALVGLARSAAAADAAPLRLVANENPYGPSESAKQAMVAALADGWMYDMEDMGLLAKLIAEREGLKPENVIVTEGSGELLKIAGLAYGSNGADVVSARPTFTQLQDYAERNGGRVAYIDLDKEMRHDLAAMEARVTNRTGLVYVCNPNNPTGTVIAAPDKLRSFIGAVSGRAMVLVDEAYIDLCDEPAKQAMVDQVKAGRNVIVARTFSKVHGMAGLRVGYGLARADIVQRLGELRTSSPNRMGLRAAVASYQDTAFQAESRKMVRQAVAMTSAAIRDLGLTYTPSQTNFVFFDTGRPTMEFLGAMRQRNIQVGRPFAPYSTWCRVSMGRVEQMPVFFDAMKAHFKKAT